MLNEERTRLIQQLWADAPKLFIHGAGSLCIDLTGQDGKEEAWPLSPEVIQWIAETLPESAVTLETGCGYSTIVFAICGARHVAVAPDYQQHRRILRWCGDHGVPCDALRLVDARSQDVLPAMPLPALDLVLIDGCHAFPAPYMDWYYTAEKIKEGGFVVVDDCQLLTGKVLAEFLDSEKGRWTLHRWIGKTAIFRKITSGPVVAGIEWIDQPYCKTRVQVPSKRSLAQRIQDKWRRLWRTGG
jgi:hypothetical protein